MNHAGKRTCVMSADSVSSQYASALVELAQSGNVLEEVHGDMDSLAALIKTDESIATYLKNPVVDPQQKKGVINKSPESASSTRSPPTS
eukprot:jgi/Pico_ML_1/54227/g30.t1